MRCAQKFSSVKVSPTGSGEANRLSDDYQSADGAVNLRERALQLVGQS